MWSTSYTIKWCFKNALPFFITHRNMEYCSFLVLGYCRKIFCEFQCYIFVISVTSILLLEGTRKICNISTLSSGLPQKLKFDEIFIKNSVIDRKRWSCKNILVFFAKLCIDELWSLKTNKYFDYNETCEF